MHSETQYRKNQLLGFVTQLQEDPNYVFSLDFSSFYFGFLDAPFIMKTEIPTLNKIRQALKSKKKINFTKVLNDLRSIFEGISDYVLSADPLQTFCQMALQKIDSYERLFSQRDNQESMSQCDSWQSTKPFVSRPLSFEKQIKMVYYLLNFQNNDELIRIIGEKCEILEQNQEEYILNLGKSTLWGNLITRTVQ